MELRILILTRLQSFCNTGAGQEKGPDPIMALSPLRRLPCSKCSLSQVLAAGRP